jgi:hypothetical protein
VGLFSKKTGDRETKPRHTNIRAGDCIYVGESFQGGAS